MKRFLLISLLVVVVLVAGAALYVRHYLHSPRVAQEVATRLEALYGGPVRVESVEVGLGGSTVNGFELFEPGTDSDRGPPWLKVGSLSTDISLWDIVRGQALPKHVTITAARVILRFDADGTLITRLPNRAGNADELAQLKQLPEFVLEKSEVILRKFGQPELVARNVGARLSRNPEGGFTLSGTAESAELGKLLLSGALDSATGTATATLKTEGPAHITQTLLDRLPYIPAALWQELQIDAGDTPAELKVEGDVAAGLRHYRLALAPQHTALRVPLLDLTVQDANGTLIVDDNLVQLRNVRGKAYGGHVQLDGDFDFRGGASTVRVPKINLTNLNVSELPESWEIPATVRKLFANGKLDGAASIEVTMTSGRLPPAAVDSLLGIAASSGGSGRWLGAVAMLAGFPQRETHTRSEGKAIISNISGGSAEIELKLGPRPIRSAQPAPRSSFAPVPDLNRMAQDRRPQPTITFELARMAAPLATAMVMTNAVAVEGGAGEEAYPEINVKVGKAANALLGGVHTLLKDIVAFGERFVAQVPTKVEPVPTMPREAASYLDLNLKLKDVDLGQLVNSLGLKLDFPVEGKVSFQVTASIPTDRAGDFKAYKAKGNAQVTGLRFAGVCLESLDTDVDYAGGILDLTSLRGRCAAAAKGEDAAAGLVRGSGKLQLVPLGDLTADVTLDGIPIREFAGRAGTVPLDGTFSGRLSVRAPAAKLKSLDAASGDGKITADRISVYGITLTDAATSVRLKDGVVRLPDLAGWLDGSAISASAELRLGGAFPFKATLNLKNWELSALANLAAKDKQPPLALAGRFTTTVNLDGTLSPFNATATGDASTAGLKINAFQIADVRFHWTTDTRKLNLTNLDLRLYGGQATGTAVLPLEADASGSVNLKLSQLDARQLVTDLALPVKIEGKIDGVVNGMLPAAPAGQPRTATLDVDVTAPKLRVQNIPTEQLHGKLDYQSGVVDYKLEGKALGGTFEVEGQIPSPTPVKKESKKNRLRIENVALNRLMEAWKMQDAVPLSGRLSIELNYMHDTPDREPVGTGRLRLANVRWKDSALATGLEGELILGGGRLRLRELTGEIAQGLARIQVTYDLHYPDRSRFSLVLEDVEAAQLLAPILGDRIKGTMQARIRGALGASWRGHANFELTRGEIYGMEVSQWRLPADWEYAPETGRMQIDIHETSAQVARGRATGKLSATLDHSWRLEGSVRCNGVDLQALIKPFAGTTQIAGGLVTGRLDFSGSEVRSINDIRGTLVASFQQAQALQMPVLRQIAPYIGMGLTTNFQSGELRARIDRGVMRVQQLTLQGGNLQFYADGTIGLDSGRLNLNVVAKTGDVGLPTLRLGAIGLRIPIAGPVPVTVLQEVSNLLANRVIYLEVTGTLHSPVVGVRPLPMLSAEAVRFFLNRANLPVPVAP
jgi:hypothetical protein